MSIRLMQKCCEGHQSFLWGVVGTFALGWLSAVQARSAAPQDPLQLLKLDGAAPGAATAGNSTCGPLTLKIKYHGNLRTSIEATSATINAQIQRQDFNGALAKSRLAAEAYSYCYTKSGTDSDSATYAAAVGHFLTEEVIAEHGANAVDSESSAAIMRARALLTYGQSGGRDVSTDLATLEAAQGRKQTPSAGSAGSHTAEAIVSEFEGNQLGFDARYDNRILQVTGPVRKVSELPGGSVWVVIVGRTPDDRVSDDVICAITDTGQKQKAALLSIPAQVTVSGTYHSSHGALGAAPRVLLLDCNVLGTGAPR